MAFRAVVSQWSCWSSGGRPVDAFKAVASAFRVVASAFRVGASRYSEHCKPLRLEATTLKLWF
jgi:hypothetical protein